MRNNGGFQDFDVNGKNRTERKRDRIAELQSKRADNRETHALITEAGIPRRKDGNKLGLRKREEIADNTRLNQMLAKD